MEGIADNNWNHLLDSLVDERCVICVGPGVYAEDSLRLEVELANFLKIKEKETRIRVYEDGWFHYLPDASEIDAWQLVKEFYQQKDQQAVPGLEKLTELPFHFALNFTPGYALPKAFEKAGFQHQFLSYVKKQAFDPSSPANQHLPTKYKPLIFNMVGEVKKRNSLVMTYNDFYTYLESIFEGNSMSSILKENMWEADYFIFLGMPFDRWYVHMLMRILQQHEANRSSKKYAANVHLNEAVTTHCAEQYTMTFVPSGIQDFLGELHRRCAERGLLRTTEQQAELDLPFEQIEEWLRENAFEKIFDHLLLGLSKLGAAAVEWKAEVMQVEGRYNDLRRSVRMGIMDDRDRIVETNRIRAVLLEIINGIRKIFQPS